MTGAFTFGVFVGWAACSTVVALLVGAALVACDHADHRIPPKQPAGVRDPETGLLFDETGRITTRTWVA